jgi:hypothetical protein
MDLSSFEFGIVHSKLKGISVSKYKILSYQHSIEPGQTAQIVRLAWLYAGSKGFSV